MQVSSPADARAFLQKYDASVADANLRPFVHRVSHYLAGRRDGPLRGMMEQYADGRPLALDLHTEIMAYKMCLIDDTVIESGHGEVHWAMSTGRRSSVPLWSAHLRHDENTRLIQENVDRFDFWYKYSGMIAANASVSPRPRKMRLTHQAVKHRTYRLREFALADVSEHCPDLRAHLPLEPRERKRMAIKLQSDYLRCVMLLGDACSLPLAEGHVVSEDKSLHPIVAGMMFEEVCGDCFCFQVIDWDFLRKKHVMTTAMRQQRLSALPAIVQHYGVWNKQHRYPPAGMECFPEGPPEMVDLLRIAPWPVLRTSLRLWSVGASDVQGCVALSGSRLVSGIEWDLLSPDTPALIILESLLNDGWAIGDRTEPHAIHDGQRVIASVDCVDCKCYLQCLVAMHTLEQRGLQTLPIHQHNLYYKLVLGSERPADIACGQPVKAYAALLAGGVAASALEVHAAIAQDHIEDRPFSCRNLALPEPTTRRTVHSSAIGARVPQEERVALMNLAWAQPSLATSAEDAAPSQDVPPAEPLRAAEMAQGHGGFDDPPTDDVPFTASGSLTALPASWVEGQPVHCEVRNVPGEAHYRRYSVRCPLSCTAHAGKTPCMKRRGAGPAQCARFGDLEPIAFLGAWLKSAPRHLNRAAHVNSAPTPQQVEAYMRHRGWLNEASSEAPQPRM